jgi:hypothetical protein
MGGGLVISLRGYLTIIRGLVDFDFMGGGLGMVCWGSEVYFMRDTASVSHLAFIWDREGVGRGASKDGLVLV